MSTNTSKRPRNDRRDPRAAGDPATTAARIVKAAATFCKRRHIMRNRILAAAGLAGVALAAAACGSSPAGTAGSPSTSAAAPPSAGTGAGGATVKTATISGATVLTNANGLHALLVRPGRPGQVELQRDVRPLLAAGAGTRDRRRWRHGQARHDQALRRLRPGHLQRAPPVHLHRRHLPRPGQGQRPQLVRRGLARGDRLRRGRPRRKRITQFLPGERVWVLTSSELQAAAAAQSGLRRTRTGVNT